MKTAIGMGDLSSQTAAITKIEIIENNLKKDELIKAITTCNGNKTQAAAELGINVRTLHRWVNKFNIPQIFSTENTSKS